MNISRDNYESYVLDFLEGNLKADQIDQFLDFINQNPDLKEEMQLFDAVILPEEQIVFPGKKQLHKAIAVNENETIAYLEGDLTNTERKLFEAAMHSQPELKREYDQFVKTRLIPDSELKYTRKNKLYRKSGPVILMNRVARIAAVLLLVWGIGTLIQTESLVKQKPETQRLTEIKPMPVIPDKKVEPVKKKIAVAETKKENEKENSNLKEIHQAQIEKPAEEIAENRKNPVRDSIDVSGIAPKMAQLVGVSTENQLAVSQPVATPEVNTAPRVMTLDEFLVDKAKKVSSEGLASAQKLARAGMDAASELSGERIGFVEKNGKISKIQFESKLLAFSIPLKKK